MGRRKKNRNNNLIILILVVVALTLTAGYGYYSLFETGPEDDFGYSSGKLNLGLDLRGGVYVLVNLHISISCFPVLPSPPVGVPCLKLGV